MMYYSSENVFVLKVIAWYDPSAMAKMCGGTSFLLLRRYRPTVRSV